MLGIVCKIKCYIIYDTLFHLIPSITMSILLKLIKTAVSAIEHILRKWKKKIKSKTFP